MVFLLGLTGNIACGKSTVGQLLAERHAADYVDADRIVHQLYLAGTPETAAIAARFGADLLLEDGTIDRRRLGDRVLGNPTALRELEDLLQPGVRAAIEARITGSSADVVVLDAIRLIEAGLVARCQAVWVVTCDRDVQIARLMASRSFSSEQATLRVDSQRPVEEKLRHATEVIANRGSLDDLSAQIDAAWQRDVVPKLQIAESSPAS
jgi:dephospho-CoA kinase